MVASPNQDPQDAEGPLLAVTGADGFLGTNLLGPLEERGFRIRALTPATAPDLADPEADWRPVLEGADAVLNLAGKAHDLRRASSAEAAAYDEVNARGAGRVAAAAASVGVARFIHVSTVKVLGEAPRNGLRFQESDDFAPVGVYAASKADGERVVAGCLAGSATEAVIVRLPLVFGAPFKGNLAVMEGAIRRGLPLPVGHSSIGSRTYVLIPDLVDLFVRVLTAPGPLPAVLHARSAPDLTAAEVARLVGARIGRSPRIVSVPSSLIRAIARLVRRPEIGPKLCDPMLVSDDATRRALGMGPADSRV